jgi:hypothetical protein
MNSSSSAPQLSPYFMTLVETLDDDKKAINRSRGRFHVIQTDNADKPTYSLLRDIDFNFVADRARSVDIQIRKMNPNVCWSDIQQCILPEDYDTYTTKIFDVPYALYTDNPCKIEMVSSNIYLNIPLTTFIDSSSDKTINMYSTPYFSFTN